MLGRGGRSTHLAEMGSKPQALEGAHSRGQVQIGLGNWKVVQSRQVEPRRRTELWLNSVDEMPGIYVIVGTQGSVIIYD